MSSQQLKQHAGDTYKLKSEKIPAWRSEVGMKSHSSLRSYQQLIPAGEGESVFMNMAPVD